MRFRLNKLFIVIVFLSFFSLSLSQVFERYPKPDFQTDYTRPDVITPDTRSPNLEILDVVVLVIALSLASFFALKQRSRRRIFILMIFSLIYFGFYRRGCVCSIGAIQNVGFALFNSSYAIPLTVIAFFIIPLLFTLFYGRIFCAAVCPLGTIQDVVVLKPTHVPAWLNDVFGIIPYIYLGLAVLLATTGAGFIICQYDPFVGFFRFGGSFNMIVFGFMMLILGTVIARPYCRYLCPYGVLLNWMSRLSKWHVTITPDECNNCRLCEESCPFGAIHKLTDIQRPENRESEVKRLALLLVLLPVVVIGSGWVVSRLHGPLSRQHFTVSLAEEIRLEDSCMRAETTEETRTFRATGKPTEELFYEAEGIQRRFKTGGWILGGFLGLIFCIKLLNLSARRRVTEYAIDTGTCFSCGRCFLYCPYEKVRLGIISPEEVVDPENSTPKITEPKS